LVIDVIQAFDEAIRLNPRFAWPWFGKSVVFDALGKTDEAAAAKAKVKELEEAQK
jgi:hypothetical protein